MARAKSRAAGDFLIVVAILNWAALTVAGELAPPLAAIEIEKLLDVGWQNSSQARRDATGIHASLKLLAPREPKVDYAYALVLMKQSRFPEAAKVLDSHLRLHKQHLAAQRAKTWLSMLTRDYSRALIEMDQLSVLIADPKTVLSSEEEVDDTAAFLGRLLGFFEGPVQGELTPATLTDRRGKISARLTASQQAVLEEGRGQILLHHEELAGAAFDARSVEAVALENERARLKDEAIRRRATIAAAIDTTNTRRQTLKNESVTEAARFDQSLANVDQRVAELERKAAVVQRELFLLDEQLAALRAAYDRERDPIERSRWSREIERISGMQIAYENDLSAARAAFPGLQRERVGLAVQKEAVRLRYQEQISKLDDEASELYRTQQRLAVETDRLEKPAGRTPRDRAKGRELKAFTTYEPYPLEAERQRLLDSLAPSP